MLIRADRLVTASDVYEPGLLRVEGDRVVEAGSWTTGTPDLAVGTLAPGLVDVHSHGGGTASFSTDPETAIMAHRRTGTTTQIASLVTESYDNLEAQVRMLAPYVESGGARRHPPRGTVAGRGVPRRACRTAAARPRMVRHREGCSTPGR